MSVNLKVHNLTFSYQSSPVLEGINTEIKKGDFVGIIGPNGSGKSTLIKNVNALLKPVEGAVLLEDEDISKMSRQRVARSMAVVPQDTSVGFDFSAFEIVMMGRVPHLSRFEKEGPKDEKIVREAMEVTNSWSLKDRSITELSGGERQRVIMARALAQEPQIILLDEPTAFLDISYQTEIFDLMRELNRKKNMTVIAVLHDLNLASQYCDYLILLKAGKIFNIGTPSNVMTVENIQEVYGTKVIISEHPINGTPYISLLPKRSSADNNVPPKKIHIIGGGGSANPLTKLFYYLGHHISLGVLNGRDTDCETARNLGLKIVEELPFSPVSQEKHRENLEVIKGSDLVILANVPFGKGNVRNLEAALFALEEGIPVLIYDGVDISRRDFTGGEAAQIFHQMKEKGAREINLEKELLEQLEKI
ncbi:heme ABC transporter ATP-binding protein [Candidatus Contubernalis alkaliaceticus]|uniref:heme ABC transporter ATP-binding protein n=1 Tax=Candidatus Contubernalis alkaliaceticus TaxID=338645 RepID=UPI001F4C1A51|nr:heme ABC transporter ATP-binding protein [Candidatus Contubernalis alkalaceticus]UNC92502.1 heme ABC transporter ATP-binding protein [Candidatus Contubernalis alkalaceticus]